MQKKHPALIIGGGINALGVMRNLGRNGIEVYCVNDKKDETAYSKYCKRHYVFPELNNEEKLGVFLKKFNLQINCDKVIFPTTDRSVLNVAHLMDELKGYRIVISDNEIIETMVKKELFYQSLKERNIPHPYTLFCDIDQFQRIGKEIGFPVYVKPSVSQIFREKFGKKGFVANSQRELNNFLRLGKDTNMDLMVQEIIPGEASNHFFIAGFFDENSNPVVVFGYKRLRMWPRWYGGSTVCFSVRMSEIADMKDIIIKYLNSIGFKGIFHAEFKRDPRDNSPKLIEVNARSWQKNIFPAICGINVILVAYLEAIGINVESISDYELDVYIIELLLDLFSSCVMICKKQLSLKEWITPFIRKNEQTIFNRDDANPFAINLYQSIIKFLRSRHIFSG